jgi:hypothetical protein
LRQPIPPKEVHQRNGTVIFAQQDCANSAASGCLHQNHVESAVANHAPILNSSHGGLETAWIRSVNKPMLKPADHETFLRNTLATISERPLPRFCFADAIEIGMLFSAIGLVVHYLLKP